MYPDLTLAQAVAVERALELSEACSTPEPDLSDPAARMAHHLACRENFQRAAQRARQRQRTNVQETATDAPTAIQGRLGRLYGGW
jgi:hypothetical protein